MTEYLFKNSAYRSELINQLLTGQLKIDPQMCNCIYKVDINKKKASLSTLEVNVDGQGQAQPCDYATTLTNLGYDIKYLGAGAYGLAAKVCTTKTCDLSYAIKIIMYDNQEQHDFYGSTTNPNRPENIEVRIFKILNERILYPGLSPHIALYIQDFTCKGVPVLWKPGQKLPFDQYSRQLLTTKDEDGDTVPLGAESQVPNYRSDKSLILISELCKLGSMTTYLTLNSKIITEEMLSTLVFQFIYTFAQIQRVIPGFRHNDSHGGNILVQADDNYNGVSDRYYIYHYNNKFFQVPVTSAQIKLWDFDFANIVGETANLKAELFDESEFGYRHVKNDYYDLHLFINDLLMIKNGAEPYELDLLPLVDKDSPVLKLLTEIVPEKYYGRESANTSYGRLRPNIEYVTPDQLLMGTTEINPGHYLPKTYEVTLDQIKPETIMGVYGINRAEFDELVKIAQTDTVQLQADSNNQLQSYIRPTFHKQPVESHKQPAEGQGIESICQLPKKLKVFPHGKCRNANHHACTTDSRWCYYCVSTAKSCKLPLRPHKKGSYSFKIPN